MVCSKCIGTTHNRHYVELIEDSADMKESLLKKAQKLDDDENLENDRLDSVLTNLEHIFSTVVNLEKQINKVKLGIKDYMEEIKVIRKFSQDNSNLRKSFLEKMEVDSLLAYKELEKLSSRSYTLEKDFDRVLSSIVCAYQVSYGKVH